MKNIIEVKNLVKRYRKAKTNAVDNISFSVAESEFFSLLGPNGAGKTTTISILTTTLLKTRGDVTIAGYDLERRSNLVRKNIGIIFQNPSLDLNLTAEENIRFHAVLYGLYRFRPAFKLMPGQYQEKVTELAKLLNLENDMFKPIRAFSGGMKRKLEIVRSIMHHPKILFLDEPTSGLDPVSRRNLWEYLLNIRKQEKTTIFLTTHYLEEAEHADHVCIINNGKIISQGTPSQIKKDLIQDFIIIDADNREKLKQRLSKLKLGFEENTHFKVNLDGVPAAKVVFAIDFPLTVLQTHTPTLEDAYLEIIKQDENHG